MEMYYTMGQASQMLQVSMQTLREWEKKGKITIIKTATNQRKVPECEITRMLKYYKKTAAYIAGGDIKKQIERIKKLRSDDEYDVDFYIEKANVGSKIVFKEIIRLAALGGVRELVADDSIERLIPGWEYVSEFFKALDVDVLLMSKEGDN